MEKAILILLLMQPIAHVNAQYSNSTRIIKPSKLEIKYLDYTQHKDDYSDARATASDPPGEQSAPNTALPRPRWRRASIKWWCGRDVTMRAVVAGWLICLPSLPFIMYPPHGRSQHAGMLHLTFFPKSGAAAGPLNSAQMATITRPVQNSPLLCATLTSSCKTAQVSHRNVFCCTCVLKAHYYDLHSGQPKRS